MTGTTKQHLAQTYEHHHRHNRGAGFVFAGRERGDLFRDWVGTGKRVLDLGCRDGALTRFFSKGNEVIGVDIDRHSLELARQQLDIEVQWFDLNEPLPFDNSQFDVVVTAEVLEHMPWPETVLAEVSRVLKPGGCSIGSVPNAFRLKNRLRFLYGQHFEQDPTHLRQFSPQSLQQMLRGKFDNVELRFLSSRFLWIMPRLTANDMAWRAWKT